MEEERQCAEAACDGNCDGCPRAAEEQQAEFRKPANKKSKIGRVIGILSGKGGVGKSTVTGLLAGAAARAGLRVGILDADITGPSIPALFGVGNSALSDGEFLYPAVTPGGISIMSVNLLLESPDTPVIWRGPVIAGAVQQFWTDVVWGELDLLFVDMPPGTGDVPLTVFQSLPVDGAILVTSPQSLVTMIVTKAVRMAEEMKVPVLGLVENMSCLTCPGCGREIPLFGESHAEQAAETLQLPLLARLPLDPDLVRLADAGRLEECKVQALDPVVNLLLSR